jgi:hypothetical protein
MIRLLRLALFLSGSVWLLGKLAQSVSIPIEPISFVAGVVAAALTGFAEFQISQWWSAVTKPYKPQAVKTDTKATPSEITTAASVARMVGGFVAGVSVFFIFQNVPSIAPPVSVGGSVVVGIITVLGLMMVAALTNRPAPTAKKEYTVKSEGSLVSSG